MRSTLATNEFTVCTVDVLSMSLVVAALLGAISGSRPVIYVVAWPTLL